MQKSKLVEKSANAEIARRTAVNSFISELPTLALDGVEPLPRNTKNNLTATPMMAFLEKIKKVSGLTDAEIAERLGATTQSVQQWRTGKAKPSRTVVRLMAQVFQTTEQAILAGEINCDLSVYGARELKGRAKKALTIFDEIMRSKDKEVINHLVNQVYLLARLARK